MELQSKAREGGHGESASRGAEWLELALNPSVRLS